MFYYITFIFLFIFNSLYAEENTIADNKAVNYILGFQEGSQILKNSYILNLSFFKKGLNDGYYNHINYKVYNKKISIINHYFDRLDQSKIKQKYLLAKQFSYNIGADIGSNFRIQFLVLNCEPFIEGFKDSLNNKKEKWSSIDYYDAVNKFFIEGSQKIKKMKLLYKNLENKQSVKSLKNGIRYVILKKGKSKIKPQINSLVLIEYQLMDSKFHLLLQNKNLGGDWIKYQNLAKPIQKAINRIGQEGHYILYFKSDLIYTLFKNIKIKNKENLILDISVKNINNL